MKVILFDGHNMLFKYFFGMPPFIKSKDGNLIHGVLGFISCIIRQTKEDTTVCPIVCFDSQAQSVKKENNEFYKANRITEFDSNPLTNPFTQLEYILNCLNYLQIPWIMKDGVEADDLIGTLAVKYSNEGNEVIIFSEDTDFYQLLSERIIICNEKKKVKVEHTVEAVESNLGISISQIIEYKALIGDKTDNINGIPGIGPKTAAKLLNKYTSIDGIFEHIDELSQKLKLQLLAGQKILGINKSLIKLETINIEGLPILQGINYPIDISTKKVFQAINIW